MSNNEITNTIGVESSDYGDWVVGRVTSSTDGLFEVADDYRVTVMGTMTVDAIGSDLDYSIAILRDSLYYPISKFVSLGVETVINRNVVLIAGDKLTVIGRQGSKNGTCDLSIVKLKTEKL